MKIRQILAAVGVLAVVVGIIWGSHEWNTVQAKARTNKFNEEVEDLFVALQKYKDRVGSYPIGGNTMVAKALQGHNPKNVIVIVGRKNELNEKGEFVDPWGTPLRIYFSDNGVLIRSAGPNRRFDDSTSGQADDFIRSN